MCGRLHFFNLLHKRLSFERAEEVAALRRLRQLLQEALHGGSQLRITKLIRRQFIALQNLCERGIKPLVHIAVHERRIRVHKSCECRYGSGWNCRLIYRRCFFRAGLRLFLTGDFRHLCRHILCVLRRRNTFRLRRFRLCRIGGSHTRL